VNYFIFIIILIILIFDGLPFIKNKQWKELLVISSLLLLGIVLITLKTFDIKSPLMVIDELMYNSLKLIIKISR
jgi:hypothetical protein